MVFPVNRIISDSINEEVEKLPIISEQERKEVLYSFNNTKVDYPKDKTFDSLLNHIITKSNTNYKFFDNVDTYDVFINNDYYGSDITEIQINTNDVVRFVVTKKDNTQEANIKLRNLLI